MLFYIVGRKRDALASVNRAAVPWLLSVGVVGSGFGIGISYMGLQMTEVINYGFLIKTTVIFTIILAHFWFHDEKITWQKIILVLLFLIGVYLISTNGQMMIPHTGDALILLGAFLLAVTNIILKTVVRYKVDSGVIILSRTIGACIVSICFVIIQKIPLFTLEYA